MSSDEHENEFQNRPHRPGRAVGRIRVRVATLVLSALLTASGAVFAFEPVLGMEFMLADTNGTTLVGYGRLDEGGLQIRLAQDASEVRVIVISPDGSARTYRGIFTEGRLQIVSEEGETTDVADALAQSRRSLSLAWPGGEAAVVPPNDEAAGGPAVAGAGGEGSSAASAGAAGDEDASGEGPGGGPPGGTPGPGRPDDVPGRGPPTDAPGPGGPGRGPPATPPGLDGRPDAPRTNLEADTADAEEALDGFVVLEEAEPGLP